MVQELWGQVFMNVLLSLSSVSINDTVKYTQPKEALMYRLARWYPKKTERKMMVEVWDVLTLISWHFTIKCFKKWKLKNITKKIYKHFIQHVQHLYQCCYSKKKVRKVLSKNCATFNAIKCGNVARKNGLTFLMQLWSCQMCCSPCSRLTFSCSSDSH